MSIQPQIHPHALQSPHHATAGCHFELIDSTRRLAAAPLAKLQTQVAQALVELGKHLNSHPLAGGSLRAKLIDDDQMAVAHERHSGLPGPTDILTFDLRQTANDPLDTDLLIDIDEASRQAVTRGHAVESELLLYIIHGVLHCLGFDDHNDDQFKEMHELEDQILNAIGIGPVFARPVGKPIDQGANP